MSYRKILVPVFGSENDRAALHAALGFGRQFGAHVEALFIRLDPARAVPYGYMGADLSGYSAQYAIEAAVRASDAAQKVATDAFTAAVTKFGIEVVEKPGARSSASAHLTVVQGDLADATERASRLADLVVFGAAGKDADRERLNEGFEAALLSGARPVIVVPRESVENPGQNIAIAFDGSATAAHAVTAAMPFLARGKSVHSFEVTDEKTEALPDLQAYLALRGVAAVEHHIALGSKDPAETLVQAVQGQRCDLLVLGGYGHSRIREFVLGGVTRRVLREGVPFAVLMAH